MMLEPKAEEKNKRNVFCGIRHKNLERKREK